MDESTFTLVFFVVVVPVLAGLLRLTYVLPGISVKKESKLSGSESQNVQLEKRNMSVLLGSGGHTGEMIRILEQWDADVLNQMQIKYIVSSGDTFSLQKLKQFHDSRNKVEKFQVAQIYRARNIGEGKAKAVINTVYSFVSTIKQLDLKHLPSVFLTNGPGTAIPIAYSLFMLKFFGLCNTKIIYVESLARVNHLSLTGLLILPISDRIVVQWPQLARKYPRCEFHGVLV